MSDEYSISPLALEGHANRVVSDFDYEDEDWEYVLQERTWQVQEQEEEMQVERIDNMFNFTFEKPSEEIVAKAKAKVAAIKAKIEERGKRIAATRAEYKITDGVLIDLLQQARAAQGRNVMSYTSNVRSSGSGGGLTEEQVTVGAGVVQFLLTEQDFIDGEKAQAQKLEVIIRNLTDLPDTQGRLRGHKLSFTELTYLGF